MKLSISNLLVTALFTFAAGTAACDPGFDAPAPVASPAYTALLDLGPERQINPASIAEVAHMMAETSRAQSTIDALRHLRAESFTFGAEQSAFWTEGPQGKLGTVFQRGTREGERVTVATLLTPDYEVISTLEISGPVESLEIFDVGIAEGCEVEPAEEGGEVAVTEAPLFAYTVEPTPVQCQIYNGLVSSGAAVADGLCLVDAGVVCAFVYAGNNAAINRCIAQRKSACAIGSDKWGRPVCK